MTITRFLLSAGRKVKLSAVPPHAWVALGTFAFGLGLVLYLSLGPSMAAGTAPNRLLPNFGTLWSHLYRDAFVNTIILGVVVAFTATIGSVALAWQVRFAFPLGWRTGALCLLSIPLISSHYLRISALRMFLLPYEVAGSQGGAETYAGAYHRVASVLGMLSWLLPLGSLIAFAGLARVNESVILAARNHGARTAQVMIELVLPQVPLELAIISIYAFGFAITDSYCNQILNSNQDYLLSSAIADRIRISDWALVSAIAVTAVLVEIGFIIAVVGTLAFTRKMRDRRCGSC